MTHTKILSRRTSNSHVPNVAIVDRFRSDSWYTAHLLQALSEIMPPGKLHAYGSKEDDTDLNHLVSKVWSPHLFPLQISFRAIKDRVSLIHIQFEFYTFGFPQFSILLLPLIMILKSTGIKIVITLHGPIAPHKILVKAVQGLKPTKSRLPVSLLSIYISAAYRIAGKLSDIIIVHSRGFKESLTGFGIDSDRIHVLPHGVPHGVKKKPKSEDDTNVLYFGTLSPRKGVEYLLSAFSKVLQIVPSAKLIVAGRALRRYSTYERFLKLTVSRLDLTDEVRFVGHVPDCDVPALFRRANVIVFPYTFSAAACGPLSFAMQFGNPVIATRTGYFREILVHKKDAILVPPGNIEELTKGMVELLTNRALRTELAKNIESKARKHSWRKVARLTLQLYLETVSTKMR